MILLLRNVFREVPLKILADDRFCGRIIGREGKIIKKLREDTDSKISVSKYVIHLPSCLSCLMSSFCFNFSFKPIRAVPTRLCTVTRCHRSTPTASSRCAVLPTRCARPRTPSHCGFVKPSKKTSLSHPWCVKTSCIHTRDVIE